ncbi:MAG TPA: TetR/AcrR family transcriptional regulator [Methanobacterium sp.]
MSVISRRQREKEQRRKDIIMAAEKLFFKRGYDNVSMNDIAKEVELSKATLYLYFDNKEALFFLIVMRGVKILNSMVKNSVDKEEKGIDKLVCFRRAYIDFVNKYPDYFKIYAYFHSGRFDLESVVNNAYLREFAKGRQYSMVSTIDFLLPEPTFNEYAVDILDLDKEIFDICCDSIKKGIEDGSIQPDVNPVEITVLLLLLLESTVNMRPDMVKKLETNGINKYEFADDVSDLLGKIIRLKYPNISKDEK